jgi:AraC-like DNA-binding protein
VSRRCHRARFLLARETSRVALINRHRDFACRATERCGPSDCDSGAYDTGVQRVASRSNSQFIADLLRAGLENLETNRAAASVYVGSAWTALRGEVVPSERRGYVPGGLAPSRELRVAAFVSENLGKRIVARELAAVAKMSVSQFQRAFRKSVGMSPHTYLLRCRVRRAQELMVQSDAALSSIALEAGFSDQSHLSRHFRRLTGMPPGVWRRNHR